MILASKCRFQELLGLCMALSYIDDLRSRSWVGFAEVAILAPELLTMSRRERSCLEEVWLIRKLQGHIYIHYLIYG